MCCVVFCSVLWFVGLLVCWFVGLLVCCSVCLLLWGLGGLDDTSRECMVPHHADAHGWYKCGNAELGRDQTAHLLVFLHLRTTNWPSSDSIMRSEQAQQRRLERKDNRQDEGRDDELDRDVVHQRNVSACHSASFAITSESLGGQLFHTALTLGLLLQVSVSVSVSVRVAMQAHCTRSSLPAAEEAEQQVAPRLWSPTLPRMCLLVQSAALTPAGSSIFRQHAGCTVRSLPPLPPNHAATRCPRRPVFQKSRRPTIARPYHNVSSSPPPSPPAPAATPGFDALSL